MSILDKIILNIIQIILFVCRDLKINNVNIILKLCYYSSKVNQLFGVLTKHTKEFYFGTPKSWFTSEASELLILGPTLREEKYYYIQETAPASKLILSLYGRAFI